MHRFLQYNISGGVGGVFNSLFLLLFAFLSDTLALYVSHISTQKEKAREDARFSGTHENADGARSFGAPQSQKTQESYGVRRT